MHTYISGNSQRTGQVGCFLGSFGGAIRLKLERREVSE